MTSDTTVVALRQPDAVEDPLTAVLRNGARRLLAQAVEAEAEAFLAEMRGLRLPDRRERVVRHGYGPERRDCREFRGWGRTMLLREPSYAATQTAFDPG